ncbi:MAG: hypothetical protein ABI648_05020 [Betaproteobacteria bacterium]|jgi:hypothetical protein
MPSLARSGISAWIQKVAALLFRGYSNYIVTGAIVDETSGHAKGPPAAEPDPDCKVTRGYPNVAAVGPYFK